MTAPHIIDPAGIRSVTPGATGIATGPWTPGSAPSTWRSPSCAQAPTSQNGYCNGANAVKPR